MIDETESYCQLKLSAAQFVGIRGDRKVKNAARSFSLHPLPEFNKIYLINEVPDYKKNGSPGKTMRGIWRPIEFIGPNGCNMRGELYRNPRYIKYESFMTRDFSQGRILIQELSDYIYEIGLDYKLSWADMDIVHPCDEIKRLYVYEKNKNI